MVTKRVPIARRYTTPISAEAVELYQRMLRIRCACGPLHRLECSGCNRWWDLHSELDKALGPTKPWIWPHLNPPTRYPDHDGVLRRYPPRDFQVELARRLREAAATAKTSEKSPHVSADPFV
jgi:hypothetical protein